MKRYALVLTIIASGLNALPASTPLLCNGKKELCDRPYNKITQLMIHDANSTMKGLTSGSMTVLGQNINFGIPNPVADQNNVLIDQLRDGMRAFKIPVHPVNGRPWAVHTLSSRDLDDVIKSIADKFPSWIPFKDKIKNKISEELHTNIWKIDFSNRPLIEILNLIKLFLDTSKNDVVTILLNYFDMNNDEWHQKVADDFKTAGLTQYMHIQNVNSPWPTLGEMIKNNKRLVLFVDERVQNNLRYNGFHYFFDFTYQSEYNFKNINELNNDSGSEALKNRTQRRPIYENQQPGGSLFQLQHFITPLIAGSESEAKKANAYDVLINRVNKHAKVLERDNKPVYPNFIMVDFYDQKTADLRRVVDELNSKEW